ncbi:MAG TPA: hypothetical protein VLB68_26740 [Pyrinomonadaceae bacterium]|nr:hypothetical protein [Pyrinomonadaceae bacterium]
MPVVLLPGFVLLLMFTIAGTCLACDCVTLPENESFRSADVVFEGEVVGIASSGPDTAYTFAVTKSLKGTATTEVTIVEGFTNCDAQFSPDVIYRVYAHQSVEKLSSRICSGNKVLKTKEPRLIQAGWHETSPWKMWYVKAAVIVVLSVLLCLLMWFLPKSRHPRITNALGGLA